MFKRPHYQWAIKNTLHWQIDVSYRMTAYSNWRQLAGPETSRQAFCISYIQAEGAQIDRVSHGWHAPNPQVRKVHLVLQP